MDVSGSGMGYAYEYRFRMDKSIIEMATRQSSARPDLVKPDTECMFILMTKFVVKRIDGSGVDEIIGEEWDFFGLCTGEGKRKLLSLWCHKLEEEYWMSREEVLVLIQKALDFAREKQNDVDYVRYVRELTDSAPEKQNDVDYVHELTDDDALALTREQQDVLLSLPFIPIWIHLDVCTVQKPGEAIGDVYGRAIRVEHMFSNLTDWDIEDSRCRDFMMDLPNERVVNVEEALVQMNECFICTKKPFIGCRISQLDCLHTFHYHCLVKVVLEDNGENRCPLCGRLFVIEN